MAPSSPPSSLYLEITSSVSPSSPTYLKFRPYTCQLPLPYCIVLMSTHDQLIGIIYLAFILLIICILSTGSTRAGIFLWFVLY